MTDREAFAAGLAAMVPHYRLMQFTRACEREQSARVRCSETSTAHREALAELAAAQKAREQAALAFEGRSR